MKKRCTYIYRVMSGDVIGALCNTMLCVNFASACAVFMTLRKGSPDLPVKVLRYKINGAYALWWQFKDFTPVVIEYLKRNDLLNYGQGKAQKDCGHCYSHH